MGCGCGCGEGCLLLAVREGRNCSGKKDEGGEGGRMNY